MKKIVLLLVCCMLVIFMANVGKKKIPQTPEGIIKVALIPGTGGISDQSFNQAAYESASKWCSENNAEFSYFLPVTVANSDMIAATTTAIQKGYNVIILPGFVFAYDVVKSAALAKNVKFICIDISEYDLVSAANLLGYENYTIPDNIFSAVYKEEITGFLAGYAAVKEDYVHLGFLGGLGVGSVNRFGYGYAQGISAAAKELGITDKIVLEYTNGGQFYGDSQITAAMDGWFQNRGVEVVFACGGSIWTSVAEAASKTNGRLIGVDSDQSQSINAYRDDMCLTSAMKGVGATVSDLLDSIQNSEWNKYGGTIGNLGLVSYENPEANYVQLPLDTWSMKNFTKEEYQYLLKDIIDGKIKIDNDPENMNKLDIKINKYPNIK